ncbi:DUF1579 family protein [Solilutibacter pythonis]|nr:DUF1579 family protein [Lysobacter pythonis]
MSLSPKAGPGHQRLRRFIGAWSGPERANAGDAPASTGHVRFQPDVEGLVLLQEYRQEVEGRIVFRGHGVMTIAPDSGDVLWWWFDSHDMPPLTPAHGRWEGETLIFEHETPQLALRHRYAFDGADRYRFSVEVRRPGETGFEPFLDADYRHERLGLHA